MGLRECQEVHSDGCQVPFLDNWIACKETEHSIASGGTQMQISMNEVRRLLSYSTEGNPKPSTEVNSSISQQVNGSPSAVVDISTTAQDIQAVKRELSRVSDVREERVNALRNQLANGTYNVSSSDIADLMIRRTLADNTQG